FFAGVQEHDDEDEEHHNGAAVNDDLDRRDEFRAHQQVETGKANHDHDQRERAVDRMLLQNEADRADDRQRRKYEKDEKWGAHGFALKRTTPAVTMTLAMETGRSSFHPTFMSWS